MSGEYDVGLTTNTGKKLLLRRSGDAEPLAGRFVDYLRSVGGELRKSFRRLRRGGLRKPSGPGGRSYPRPA